VTEDGLAADALAAAIAVGEARRREVAAMLSDRQVDLPLRYWRQAAHFTTPAADAAMARKAVEGGTAPVARMLGRFELTAADLAEALDLPTGAVEARLSAPVRAPLVMLDGEDAIAPGEAVAQRATAVAVDTLVSADWATGTRSPSLRFYRPPGLAIDTSVRDLYTLLWRLRERTEDVAAFPLDGIVMPKVGHPEEVDLVNDLLDRAEERLGLVPGRLRVAYLVESGWAATQLPELVRRSESRLAALIFGIADFSADLGLPAIGTDHPLAVWARAELVATAGAAGVPAIDGMTLAYPVADPALDAAANRRRWLARMRLVYDDAVAARDLGMTGKWVGHPAQLFAVLLAFEVGQTDASLRAEAAKLEAYEAALRAEQGATMIDGVMSDRATDRHARVLLRRATAAGRFDPRRAHALGLITDSELAETTA
jgi:citrate lyase beta subunit